MSRVDWTAVKAHTNDILGGVAAKIIVKYIYLHTYVCKCLFAHIHFVLDFFSIYGTYCLLVTFLYPEPIKKYIMDLCKCM